MMSKNCMRLILLNRGSASDRRAGEYGREDELGFDENARITRMNLQRHDGQSKEESWSSEETLCHPETKGMEV
jgi:hypothetical protein